MERIFSMVSPGFNTYLMQVLLQTTKSV
ncbi:hypothetical protein CBM2626_B160023 [Cupriavidus taiwanensis]|nr:hypothetical protein CBM2626_B160023 [Cupriavidus taiwanensis]